MIRSAWKSWWMKFNLKSRVLHLRAQIHSFESCKTIRPDFGARGANLSKRTGISPPAPGVSVNRMQTELYFERFLKDTIGRVWHCSVESTDTLVEWVQVQWVIRNSNSLFKSVYITVCRRTFGMHPTLQARIFSRNWITCCLSCLLFTDHFRIL